MNKEIIVETLKDALTQLGSANELFGELTAKEKVTAHIEMAKAYALAGIAAALSGQEQAPETPAETKKQKGSKKTAIKTDVVIPDIPAAPEATPEEAPFEDPTPEPAQEEAPAPVATETTEETPVQPTEPVADETPLVTIIEGVWIQFNRPVIHNEFDYSAWLMEYVNAVDEAGNPTVGAQWANDYMTAFTGGKCTTVEALNDDNAMGYINFVLDAIEAANQQ